jgi:hypothetical protein
MVCESKAGMSKGQILWFDLGPNVRQCCRNYDSQCHRLQCCATGVDSQWQRSWLECNAAGVVVSGTAFSVVTPTQCGAGKSEKVPERRVVGSHTWVGFNPRHQVTAGADHNRRGSNINADTQGAPCGATLRVHSRLRQHGWLLRVGGC